MSHRRHKRNRRKPERVERAIARQTAHAARSPAEQRAFLEHRGHGHCVEAMRLRKVTP